jgi:uncharacterized protein (DUF302 family)
MSHATTYSRFRTVDLSFDDTLVRARAALAEEGFGILCEIDVQATMSAKLGISRDPYTILGACDPTLAHRALTAEPQLGVLLPCNVAVFVDDGTTVVSTVAAKEMLGLVGNPSLEAIAHEVAERLERVLEHVTASGGNSSRSPGARRRPSHT